MNKLEKVDELTPYQLDFPKEALPEIFVKDALTTDERMWVPQADNVWFRPLCLNRSQGYWVTLLKVKNQVYCHVIGIRKVSTVLSLRVDGSI